MNSIMQVEALQGAYNYFNDELFNGELNTVYFNFVWSKKSHGHVGPDRWQTRDGEEVKHELSLTPNTLSRTPLEVYSTLVHEMCHVWQLDLGNPSRSGYHNKEWADKMEQVGLIPSSTGEPGGKRTGQRMTHYIEENGVFQKAFEKMPQEYIIPFIATPIPEKETKKKAKNKIKYVCSCNQAFWGKPGIFAICKKEWEKDGEIVLCNTEFIPQT